MPADRGVFRKLLSVHVIPKKRVTCVTRVTTNQINNLAGHKASAACVTRVTEASLQAASHLPRDHYEQECVTGEGNKRQRLTYLSHAVTRSRTESVWEKKELLCGSPEAAVLIDWLSYYQERAAIREYEGGLDRAEAERLAFEETVSTLGPIPRDLPTKSSKCRVGTLANGLEASAVRKRA